MPRRGGRVTVKAIKDKNIAEMFNQMLGAGTVNMGICYPKYCRIKECLTNLVKVLKMFNASHFFDAYPEFTKQRNEIESFITESQKEIDELFDIDFSEYEWNLNLVEEEDKKKFSERYEQIKKCNLVNTFIVTCDNLVNYKKHIGNPEKLSYKFILTMAGSSLCPFPFTTFNLKYIFDLLHSTTGSDSWKHFILVVVNKIYQLTYVLYKLISSPDIDVDEFVEVIMESIKKIRGQIPRCDKAFKKIEESVAMLKDNFEDYYKDFIETKNSTIIMENFVLDVAKDTKSDPETTRQFRTIISYYRKMAGNQIKDPRVKALFDHVHEQFQALDKHENLVRVRKQEEDDATDESSEEQEEPESGEDSEEIKIRTENQNKSVDELAEEIEKSNSAPTTRRRRKR